MISHIIPQWRLGGGVSLSNLVKEGEIKEILTQLFMFKWSKTKKQEGVLNCFGCSVSLCLEQQRSTGSTSFLTVVVVLRPRAPNHSPALLL